jgi:hypothetical protein
VGNYHNITEAAMEITHTEETINGLFLANYSKDTFDRCTLSGRFERCNFGMSTFTECTFEPGCAFVDCNLVGVDGLDKNLVTGGLYSTKAEYQAFFEARRKETQAKSHVDIGQE